MSYRNRTGFCGLLIGCTLAIASACGGLDNVKVVITDDGGSGNPSGGGHPGAGTPGGGDTSASGATGEAGAAGADASGGEGGEMTVPDPQAGPPRVLAVSPSDALTGVAPTGSVQIAFSEPLDAATVSNDSVQLKDESGALVAGTLSYADAVVTISPAVRLNLLGKYSVSVNKGVTDAGGTPLEGPFSSIFTVRDGVWGKAEASLTARTAAFHNGGVAALATDGAGRAVAVWAQASTDAASTYDIYAALFNQGKGWAAPTKVNTNAGNCQYPSVAMNASGNLIVGWIETDSTLTTQPYSIQARRNIAGTWDATSTKIDLPGMAAFTLNLQNVVVAINANGHSHVVWDAWDYNSTATPTVNDYGVFARHADAAGNWDTTQTSLSYLQVGSGVGAPALTFDAAGNGFAAYQFTVGSSPTSTIVHRYLASTNKWGLSAVGSSTTDGGALPVAVATSPSGEAILTWLRQTGTDFTTATYDVMGSYFNKAWSMPAVISSAKTTTYSSNINLASAVWTGSSFLVAWAQSAGTPYVLYANQYKTSWGSAAIISDGNHSGVLPRLSADGRGNALAVWFQQSDAAATSTVTPMDIAFSRFNGATDKWTDPALASSAFGGYRFPQVVTLADGTALTAWQRTTRPTIKTTAVTGVLENEFN